MLPMQRAAMVCVLALLGYVAHAQEPAADAAPPLPGIKLPANSTATFHRDGLRAPYMLFWRRPTLVVCWSADDAASARKVVPAALDLAESYGGDLGVLFVERSGRSYADMLRFAAREHWLGGTAAWTSEVPPGAEALPTPSFVLLSVRQATLLAGDPVAQRAELAAAARIAVDERRHGEAGASAQERAALTALAEGQPAKALGLVDAPFAVAAARKLDQPAQRVADEILNESQWCTEMLYAGYFAAARSRVEALSKALASRPIDDGWRKLADGALEVYTCGDQNKELKASADMLELQDQLFAKGPSASLAKALQKCAKSHAGTHAAERATFLATIAAP